MACSNQRDVPATLPSMRQQKRNGFAANPFRCQRLLTFVDGGANVFKRCPDGANVAIPFRSGFAPPYRMRLRGVGGNVNAFGAGECANFDRARGNSANVVGLSDNLDDQIKNLDRARSAGDADAGGAAKLHCQRGAFGRRIGRQRNSHRVRGRAAVIEWVAQCRGNGEQRKDSRNRCLHRDDVIRPDCDETCWPKR